MEDTIENLTEKFSDINLSDLEEFEKEYQIKMNTVGGPEMKPNVAEPSHISKKKHKPFYEYIPKVKAAPWKKEYKPNQDTLVPISNSGSFLNIDCKENPRKTLAEWGMQMKLFFTYNGANDDWNVTTNEEKIDIFTDILITSFTGNIFNWWRGLSDDTQMLIKD